MITLEVQNGEYILRVPYELKDRVKTIPGHRWDPALKAWIFPKQGWYKKAILSEFDSDEIGVHRDYSDFDLPADLEDLKDGNPEVRQHLDAMEDSRQVLWDTLGELSRAHEAVLDCKARLNDFYLLVGDDIVEDLTHEGAVSLFRTALRTNSDSAFNLVRCATAESQNLALHEENRKLKSLTTAHPARTDEAIVDIVREVVGNQLADAQRIGRVALNESAPILLQTQLQEYLLLKLGRRDSRPNFVELINEAGDAQLISRDGKQYCHYVRIQRNLFAHQIVPDNEVRARATLALMAYALVANELKDI